MEERHEITDDDLILVTGANGFLAAHIIKQLLEGGYRVRGTVRSLKDIKNNEAIYNYTSGSKHNIELVEVSLTSEKGWTEAIKDVTYVIHTASPFPMKNPKNEEEVTKPAVDGVLNVFKACVGPESKVKRVVLTSSALAITGEHYETNKVYNEEVFAPPAKQTAYTKSKILSEKAAWKFVNDRKANNLPCFDLVVINPGLITGPLLSSKENTSSEYIKKIMQKEFSSLPDLYSAGCDVRDVARVHILALTLKQAASNRYLVNNSSTGDSFVQYATWLNEEFKDAKLSTKLAPNFLLKVMANFNKDLAQVVPFLGKKPKFDNKKLPNTFNMTLIDRKQSIIDTAYSLIERDMVKGYKKSDPRFNTIVTRF